VVRATRNVGTRRAVAVLASARANRRRDHILQKRENLLSHE
jgi:hypothetical protein